MANVSEPFLGPIAVTVVYFGLWYALLFGLQSRTRHALQAAYDARGEVFDRYLGGDRRMLAADRAVANTLEQMGPFLGALWLHAVFVSPTVATVLGTTYVALRSAYPFLLGNEVGETQPRRVLVATGPCYLIVIYMLGSTLVTALLG